MITQELQKEKVFELIFRDGTRQIITLPEFLGRNSDLVSVEDCTFLNSLEVGQGAVLSLVFSPVIKRVG